MNQKKFVFAQITESLPCGIFDRIVHMHNGNKYMRTFTCWNQMLSMFFGQLTNWGSICDLIDAIDAHKAKPNHLGLGPNLALTTIAKANIRRNYMINEAFTCHLVNYDRMVCILCSKVNENIHAFNSPTIDLCLSFFWLSGLRKAQRGIKMHTLYVVKIRTSSFVYITIASVIVNAIEPIQYEKGSYYIFNRGYNDFERLYRIQMIEACFVLGVRDILKFYRMYSQKVDKNAGVKCNQTEAL